VIARVVLAAGVMVAAGMVAAPAQAVNGTVTGDFVCESSAAVAGVAGTSLGDTRKLDSTAHLDPTVAAGAPAVALVTVLAPPTKALPLSPPVALTDVTVSSVDVQLDVFTVAGTNSPTGITGAPDVANGSLALVGVDIAAQDAATPWPITIADVPVTLPAGQLGDRQWVRLKALTIHWSSTTDGIPSGTTTCRLVAEAVGGSTTVEQPLTDALSPLSRQYPESKTDFTSAAPATFGDFLLRNNVTQVAAGGGGDDSCVVTPPDTSCDTGQEIGGEVTPGSLRQDVSRHPDNPSSTALLLRDSITGQDHVTVGVVDQTMLGSLNPITVTDQRGGAAGWSLTAQLDGPLADVSGFTIPTGSVSVTGLSCAPTTGSATRRLGAGGVLDTTVTLCGVDTGVDDSAGSSGGGQYTVDGTLEVDVPAFQPAGEYSATLYVTLA
jgi:hypothetical protein